MIMNHVWEKFFFFCDQIERNTYLSPKKENEPILNQVVICYKSYKDIPGDYKYEKGHSCSTQDCGRLYYYNSSGVFKCIYEDIIEG